jgi:hypothetical protein
MTDLFGKRFQAENDNESVVGSSKTSVSRPLVLEEGGGSAGGSVGSVGGSVFHRMKDPKLIVEKANELQIQLMRSCNIAAHHGNSQQIQRFVDHIIDHAQFFSKNRGLMLMGRRKLSNQRYHFFNNLVYVVK